MKKTNPTAHWLGSAALVLALTLSGTARAQTCDSYNFSSATGWTTTTLPSTTPTVTINTTTGVIDASTAPGGFQAHYVSAYLSATLNNSWTCDFEFVVTAGIPSHSLVSFTESSTSVANAHGHRTVSGGTMNYTNTDCIEAFIYESTGGANFELRAWAKKRHSAGAYGSTTTTPPTWSSTPGIIVLGASGTVLGTTYYARLQRLDATNGMISLFTTAARTTLVSSQCFDIDPDVDNLDAIQSGTCAEGGTGRSFSGTVDNVEICNLNPAIVGPTPVCLSGSAVNYRFSNGNSSVTSGTCGFPGATSITWAAPATSSLPSGTSGTCTSGININSIDVNATGDVTCAVAYSCGVTITYSLAVTVNPCRLAQNQTDDPAQVASLYPNPATKQVNISTAGVAEQVFITDASGRKVISVQPVAEQMQLDISALSPGIYFVNILLAESVQTKQLVVEE